MKRRTKVAPLERKNGISRKVGKSTTCITRSMAHIIYVTRMLCRPSLRGIATVFILAVVVIVSLSMANRKNNSLTLSNRITNKRKQGVVLLAGPHKTSSSSIQLNVSHWLNNTPEKDFTGLTTQWAWPSPVQAFLEHKCDMDDNLESKIFYQLLEAMKGQHKKSRCMTSFYSRKELIKLYHDEIYKRWNQGYNLVIGSEAIDFIASERRKHGPKMLNDLIKELPWHAKEGNALHGSDEDITAVVGYRAPRVDHLVSLWHQCCMKRMSFYKYLTHHIESVVDPLRSLDSLKLTRIFLEKNIETVLIDTSGVKALGYDMSNVIACDVLNAECSEHKTFPRAPNEKVRISNMKSHSDENFKVADSQLDRINDVIEMYDCNFVTMMQHAKLKVIYSKELDVILSKCKERTSTIHSREEMVRQIIIIARDVTTVGRESMLDYDGDREQDDDYYGSGTSGSLENMSNGKDDDYDDDEEVGL